MRLTLRTLLAWMDDTLEPSQVREIGKQVSESPFAQELKGRIERVTRQRRLTVPGSSGADATDPNLVAAYLDNDLDPDAVAEFEKRCLTSDVNLAETASVHQILSLLGQKVKVPDEARARMYQLVKGREAITPRRTRPKRPVVKEPVTKPIQPWVLPEPPRRPWIERYGPAVACLLLIGLASWTAWSSLGPPETTTTSGTGGQVVIPKPTTAVGAASGAARAESPGPEVAAKVPSETAKPEPGPVAEASSKAAPAGEPPASTKTAKAEESAKGGRPATVVIPVGAVGVAEKSDGILLRYNPEKREWERLLKETPLKRSDRVLCLDPFRAWIDLGKLRIGMVGETEVRILSQAVDQTPMIELLQGRILIREPGSNKLKVAFASQVVTLDLATDCVVGLERVDLSQYGQPIRQPESMGILCHQGEITLDAGDKQETMKPLNVALVQPFGQVQVVSRPALPPWLTQTDPSPNELDVKERFIKLFHADRPVLTELVGAIEDDQADVKLRAISALKAMGDLSMLMPTLSRANDRLARRGSMSAIHSYMAQGPEASASVRAALEEQFGQELGDTAHHMLIGYSPEETARPEIYTRLVGLLSPDQDAEGIIGIRELALTTLKRLTGRDDLGYDPDHPAGKGFDAWNDLLRRDELRPPAPRPAAKTKGAR